MKKPLPIAEIQKRMEYYCAYRERCHKEVAEKLRAMGVAAQVVPEIITHLITENYLNETRFSQSFARGKFRIKKWGKRRIVQELKWRGISEWNIKKALEEISEEEYQATFLEVCRKFWNANKHLPEHKKKAKVIAALKYRGWELDGLWEVFEQLYVLEKK